MSIILGIILVMIVAAIVKPVMDLFSKGFKKLIDLFKRKKE